MARKINLAGKEVLYYLSKSSRSRSVRLSITSRGLCVSSPRWVSLRFIESCIHQKSVWIFRQFQQAKEAKSAPIIEYNKYKHRAKKFIVEKIRQFNTHYGFVYHRVSIRNQSTRWGSCSRAGNLNFNVRLFFVDPALADYVVVHELCHLQEMNHSVKFWKLVAESVPDYKEKRRKLKEIHLA